MKTLNKFRSYKSFTISSRNLDDLAAIRKFLNGSNTVIVGVGVEPDSIYVVRLLIHNDKLTDLRAKVEPWGAVEILGETVIHRY